MNILIVCVFLGIILCGFILDRSKVFSYAIMAVLFILICFSYDEYDYQVYTAVYDSIGRGMGSPYEPLFNFLMKIGNIVGLNFFVYRMVIVAIGLILINSTIQKFADSPAFVWALFIIFPGWIITTLFRHMMALSVITFGIRYLFDNSRGSTLKLILCILISAFIHNSFWIFIILLLAKHFSSKFILLISVSTIFIVYMIGSNNFLFELFEMLPISEGYLDKYMTDSYSNIKGIIYNILRQAVIMFSGYSALYMFKNNLKHGALLSVKQDAFMNKVFAINNASVLILGAVYYTTVASRMYHIIVLINAIAWGICLKTYRKDHIYFHLSKMGVLLIFCLLAVLACTIESSVLFDRVLLMHFKTNSFINMFN